MEKSTQDMVAEFLANGGTISVDPKTLQFRNTPKTKKWQNVANVAFHKSR